MASRFPSYPIHFFPSLPISLRALHLPLVVDFKMVKCCVVYMVMNIQQLILNDIYPSWYKEFPTVSDMTNSLTRQRNKLYVPMTRTEAGARNLQVMGPETWNSLPLPVTQAASLLSFKRKRFNHLLNKT